MIVLALDPGSEHSALVEYSTDNRQLICFCKEPNTVIEHMLQTRAKHYSDVIDFVMEYPAPRGQPMYTQLVDTIYWIGRFSKCWNQAWHKMDRKDVKMTLCRSAKANDAQIRAAIISRYPASGGGAIGQIGTKSDPGPLYGVSKDVWAALAVAITRSVKLGLEADTI